MLFKIRFRHCNVATDEKNAHTTPWHTATREKLQKTNGKVTAITSCQLTLPPFGTAEAQAECHAPDNFSREAGRDVSFAKCLLEVARNTTIKPHDFAVLLQSYLAGEYGA